MMNTQIQKAVLFGALTHNREDCFDSFFFVREPESAVVCTVQDFKCNSSKQIRIPRV